MNQNPPAAAGVTLAPQMSVTVTGTGKVAKELEQTGKRVGTKAYSITRHYGAVLQSDIRARARSLFAVTDYDRNIKMRMGTDRNRPTVEVGTDDPHGYRLEQGFIGRDARGRFVSQPPRPHFRPAADQIGRRYAAALARLFK